MFIGSSSFVGVVVIVVSFLILNVCILHIHIYTWHIEAVPLPMNISSVRSEIVYFVLFDNVACSHKEFG